MISAFLNLPTTEENRNKQIYKYDIQILISTVEKIKEATVDIMWGKASLNR